jgi:hypothetical protein
MKSMIDAMRKAWHWWSKPYVTLRGCTVTQGSIYVDSGVTLKVEGTVTLDPDVTIDGPGSVSIQERGTLRWIDTRSVPKRDQ